MQIDTIVTDLDDTLLDANTALSPYTLQVIGEAKRRGIRLIPASGRATVSMRSFVDQLDAGQPYISCNGAELRNPDHSMISSSMLTPEQTKKLLRYFAENDIYAQVYKDDYFYFAEHCEANALYAARTGMKGMAVGDLIAFTDFPTPKVLSISTPEAVDKMLPVIQAEFPEISFTISKPHFLEAQPRGVTKGSALKQLSGILGFTPERTLVFGDSLNDVSMFAFTKYSVAMRNARPEVIRAANFVTDKTNAQDGLAHFVEDHVLTAAFGV